MTDYIPQTSASDRYAAARAALAEFEASRLEDQASYAWNLADALRALITPPGVHESESEIAYRLYPQVLAEASRTQSGEPGVGTAVSIALRKGIRAGIQNAHETWECEDRPTQEQMLRWLGIDYMTGPGEIVIDKRYIDREED